MPLISKLDQSAHGVFDGDVLVHTRHLEQVHLLDAQYGIDVGDGFAEVGFSSVGLVVVEGSFNGEVGLADVFGVLGVEAVQELEVCSRFRVAVEFPAVEYGASSIDSCLDGSKSLIVRCLIRRMPSQSARYQSIV
jgi:hypothetical protein